MFRQHFGALHRLPRNARLYLVAAALSAFSAGAFGAVYNLYVRALGYGAEFLGLVLTAGLAGARLGALPAGAVVDRLGPRFVLLAASLVVAAGVGVQLATGAALALLVANAVAGAGAGAFSVAAAPFLARNSPAGGPAGGQMTLFSLDTAVTLAALAAGSAAGGQFAALLAQADGGLPPQRVHWLTLVVASAIGAGSFAALLMTTDLPNPPDPPAAGGRRASAGRGGPEREGAAGRSQGDLPRARSRADPVGRQGHSDGSCIPGGAHQNHGGGLRADAATLRLAAVAALIGLGAGLFLPYLNVFFVEELGASPAAYGWLSAAGTALRLVATLAAPRLAARLGVARAIGWTQLASVPFLLALGLAPHLAAAGAALLLRGALMNLTVPLQASFTMDRLPPATRGGGNALIWLAGQAARAAGTLAGGALIGGAGHRLAYPLAGALYTAAAILFLRWFAPARPAAPA